MMIRYPLMILAIYAFVGIAYLFDGPNGTIYSATLFSVVFFTLMNVEDIAGTMSFLVPRKRQDSSFLKSGHSVIRTSDPWPVIFFFALMLAPIPITLWAYVYNPRGTTFWCLLLGTVVGYLYKTPMIWRGVQSIARFLSSRKQ